MELSACMSYYKAGKQKSHKSMAYEGATSKVVTYMVLFINERQKIVVQFFSHMALML